MNIYQRGSVWYVYYSLHGRVRYAVGTKAQAAEELKRIKYELAHEIHRPRRKLVFDNLLEKYLKWGERHKEASSYERDVTSSKPLTKCFAGRLINHISHEDLEKYMMQRLDGILRIGGYSRKTRLSKATVNREAILMKHMFKKATEWGYLKQNQLQYVKLFKEPGARIRYATADEWQRLLSASTPEPRELFIFAANTGLRAGEIFSLKWPDIDWQERQIMVIKTKNNTPRIVPMNQVVHKLLAKRRQHCGRGYVFPGKNGQRRTDVKTAFKAACRRAGISNLRFHDLRHSFGTWLVNQGADIKTVQELLGHKCLKSTERYLHPNDERKRKVIETITGMSEKASPNLPQEGTHA
jgi:integrase